MFCAFFLLILLGAILMKVGAMALLLSLLIPAVKILLAIIVLLIGAHIWRTIRRRQV